MIGIVTKKDLNRLNLAYEIARLSTCRFKMGATIYRGKSRLALACNVLKSHPEHARYPGNVVSIHAEHRAILLAQTRVAGAILYIARYGGTKGTSKPCAACRVYLQEAGIRAIVYTVNNRAIKEYL